MFSLVFMVCMAGGVCISVAPEQVFTTVSECETMAYAIVDENKNRVLRGELPAHNQQFMCVAWGEPV